MSRRVLVTGGARGIGEAIVRTLAAAGFDVEFTYNASRDAAESLVDDLAGSHPDAALVPHQCDLSEPSQVDRLAERLAEDGEGFYGMVHNAGRSYDSLAAMVDLDAAAHVMQVNFWSMVRLVKSLVRPMMSRREGRIVAIGSVTALRGNQGNAVYAASKAAVLGYCMTLSTELARRGITVNYVAPGYVDTEMLARYADYREKLERQIPAQRYAAPGDIAATVSFLMSDAAAYVTGAQLSVDGGLGASLGIQR